MHNLAKKQSEVNNGSVTNTKLRFTKSLSEFSSDCIILAVMNISLTAFKALEKFKED